MKINIYIAAFIAIVTLSSCNKWLTVTPQGQVDAKELLTSVYGYNSALGGVYYELSSKTLYGKEMSYGAMDVLSQYWETRTQPTHSYYQLSNYDYKSSNAVSIINSIWKSFYVSIAECNRILEGLDENRNTIGTSELFEGEALGLRAFCHMELFKLFGPVIKNSSDLDKKAIAYRTNFDIDALEFMSGKDVLANAEKDLKRALDFLKNDPIRTIGRKADGNTSLLDYNSALNRRGNRMNYYAVLAMLARVEQLRMNHDAAYIYAKRLIDECKESKVVRLVRNLDFPEGYGAGDYNFSTEMIFGIYINDLWDRTDTDFRMNGKSTDPNASIIINPNLYAVLRDDLYFRLPDGSATDLRYRNWLIEKNTSAAEYDFAKVRRKPRASEGSETIFPEMGIFRLSEAYYIACEAQIGKDNDLALSLLNEVRISRNMLAIEAPVAEEMLREYLLRELRKDYIGEGNMFATYKRLFAPIHVKGALTIDPSESNFVFPIPDSEYEFSPNVKPTSK